MTSQLISEVVFFMLGLGFKEAILKPISIKMYRRALSFLPELYDMLDPVIPNSIVRLSSEEMRELINRAIDFISETRRVPLSKKERDKLLEEFVKNYDPVIAASKVSEFPKG